MDYLVRSDHPCFEEAAMFTVTWAGVASATNVAMITKGYVEHGLIRPSEHFVLPDLLTSTATLKSADCVSSTKIENLGSWVNYISGNDPVRPEEVKFHFVSPDCDSKPDSSDQHLGSLENSRFIVEHSICQAIGMAYERNRLKINDLWGRKVLQWPQEVQFFRHCRNACYHGNTFDIWDDPKKSAVDASKPPRWKQLIIPDTSINGSRFAGNFFAPQFVLPFLAEIGEMLR